MTRNTQEHSEVLAYFTDNSKYMKEDTRNAVIAASQSNNPIVPIEASVGHKKELPTGQGSIVPLLDSNVKPIVGITDFQGQQVQAGQNFAIDAIYFGVSGLSSTARTDEEMANETTKNQKSTAAGVETYGLESAVLTIRVGANGKVVFRKTVGELMMPTNAAPGSAPDSVYYNLKSRLHFFDGEKIDLELNFGAGKLAGTDSNYRVIEVRFIGHTIQA